MAHDLVKVVLVVQLDGRMLRFLLQVKLYCHWHYLASILVESELPWQVHFLQIVRVRGYYRAGQDSLANDCLTRALAEDDNSEECAILCESGIGLVFMVC